MEDVGVPGQLFGAMPGVEACKLQFERVGLVAVEVEVFVGEQPHCDVAVVVRDAHRAAAAGERGGEEEQQEAVEGEHWGHLRSILPQPDGFLDPVGFQL